MALLTADDVHWKQFQGTKFREGYDQDEVDEFLDEVVETIATLQEENETLKRQLDEARTAAAGAPVGEAGDAKQVQALKGQLEEANAMVARLQRELEEAKAAQADMTQMAPPAPAAAPAEDKAAQEQIAQLQAALSRSQAETNEARHYAEQARGELQQVQAQLEQAKSAAEAPATDEPQDATSMLSLAQRVHDEYVRNGQEEGDRIVADSRAKAGQIIREAKEERQRVLDALTSERTDLESHIDQLKSFESDYRVKISDHLRSLLEHVNEDDKK